MTPPTSEPMSYRLTLPARHVPRPTPQRAFQTHQSLHQLQGHQPGEARQIDFTHMPSHKKLGYLLTLVDMFTGWLEAFPTSREFMDMVAQALLEHTIPRFGLPETIQSDNGPAFTSKVVKLVSAALGTAPHGNNTSPTFHTLQERLREPTESPTGRLPTLPLSLTFPPLLGCQQLSFYSLTSGLHHCQPLLFSPGDQVLLEQLSPMSVEPQ